LFKNCPNTQMTVIVTVYLVKMIHAVRMGPTTINQQKPWRRAKQLYAYSFAGWSAHIRGTSEFIEWKSVNKEKPRQDSFKPRDDSAAFNLRAPSDQNILDCVLAARWLI